MRDTVAGAASLGKAVAVLDGLAADGSLNLAGLVGATGLPRATAYRLATALVSYGLVDKGADGTYRLGGRLVELGRLAGQRRRSLAHAATPVLERLRDGTGESVQLFVAEGARRICVVSLESPHSLRTIVAIGAALPMDKGSAGRVLAWRPRDPGPGLERERRGARAGGGVGQRAGVPGRGRGGRGVGLGDRWNARAGHRRNVMRRWWWRRPRRFRPPCAKAG